MGVEVNNNCTIKHGKNFFHIGSMEWLPNKEACESLVLKVWPKIVAIDKDCHLHLAGKGMDSSFRDWESPNVHIHGEVESAKDFMNANNCMIIPLKSASGLRIKALEAMSLGKPIVSTKIGMSGINFTNRENCLIADTLEEQVQAITLLANDENLYCQIAENGYNFVATNYDYQQVITKTINFYESLIE